MSASTVVHGYGVRAFWISKLRERIAWVERFVRVMCESVLQE